MLYVIEYWSVIVLYKLVCHFFCFKLLYIKPYSNIESPDIIYASLSNAHGYVRSCHYNNWRMFCSTSRFIIFLYSKRVLSNRKTLKLEARIQDFHLLLMNCYQNVFWNRVFSSIMAFSFSCGFTGLHQRCHSVYMYCHCYIFNKQLV